MKRVGNLYEKIYDMDNLILADKKARKGKAGSYGIWLHDKNRQANLVELHDRLKNKTYQTSKYNVFTITQRGKEREIYQLPYFPDRICHHAIMNVLEPVWMKVFTNDTYSCIKKRGVHLAARRIRKVLADKNTETQYCLKLDIRKYYPSINHEVLKEILRYKIKDKDLLYLLDEIIDSAPGVPIGNYLSQFFANIYLAYFDHWIKEEIHVKYYYRYCDDMVMLANNKEYLHKLRSLIKVYLLKNLDLQLKSNYQVFPVSVRGIDFLGYVFYSDHIMLRKSIKKAFARKIKTIKDRGDKINMVDIAGYWGWAKHCNSSHLLKKLVS